MRETVIKCDRCESIIENNPRKIFIEETDRQTGDYGEVIYPNIRESELCESCIQEIAEFITDKHHQIIVPLAILSEKRPEEKQPVQKKIEENKITGNRTGSFDLERALQLKESGMDYKQIAKEMNCNTQKVNNQFWAYRKKLKEKEAKSKPADGLTASTIILDEMAFQAKQEKTKLDVGKIMALVKAKWSDTDIAREMHTDEETIQKLTCVYRFQVEKGLKK